MPEFTLRAVVVGLMFSLGCSGGPTTSESSTEGSTSAGGSSSGSSTVGDPTNGASGTETSGSSGTETSGSSSAGSTSEGSSSTTSAQTTGETSADPPACAAIVGSRECALLAEVSGDLELSECLLCQGIACGQQASCDDQYPCIEGAIVIQGCCTDEQCAGLTPFCGMYSGTNFVCVRSDDV